MALVVQFFLAITMSIASHTVPAQPAHGKPPTSAPACVINPIIQSGNDGNC